MPNEVSNKLKFSCSTSTFDKVLHFVKAENEGLGSVDFNKLIPMPAEVVASLEGGSKTPCIDLLRLNGTPLWYSWCCENWGTKWNAYFCDSWTPGSKELSFVTAWEPVPEIVRQISVRFPETEITYSWEGQRLQWDTGVLVFKEGKIIESELPDGVIVSDEKGRYELDYRV